MADNNQDLIVQEGEDGSAIVHIPEDGSEPAGEGGGEAAAARGGDDDDDGDDGEGLAAGGAAGDDGGDGDGEGSGPIDPEREALREARREERRLKKQVHREKARESNHLITLLRRQNSEMAERLAVLERKTTGAEMARLDKAIEDASVRVEYAKMKHTEAIRAQDGDAATKAQDMWYEAKQALDGLSEYKRHVTQPQAAPQLQQPAAPPPDPAVKRRAEQWMRRNDWYNPQGGDFDSDVTATIDRQLTAEGYDPTSAEYWQQLDARIGQHLPHRAQQGNNGSRHNTKPRMTVTGSGRETVGSTRTTQIRLSPERVSAMREAGLWDDPAKRNAAIRKYAEWDRQNKRG